MFLQNVKQTSSKAQSCFYEEYQQASKVGKHEVENI